MSRGSRSCRWSLYKHHGYLKKQRIIKLAVENMKCESCGGIAKVTHHIDLSKTNHELNNLMALCCKCHNHLHMFLCSNPAIKKSFKKILPDDPVYFDYFVQQVKNG